MRYAMLVILLLSVLMVSSVAASEARSLAQAKVLLDVLKKDASRASGFAADVHYYVKDSQKGMIDVISYNKEEQELHIVSARKLRFLVTRAYEECAVRKAKAQLLRFKHLCFGRYRSCDLYIGEKDEGGEFLGITQMSKPPKSSVVVMIQDSP